MNDLPRTADSLIVGGGVMGASIAYHLAARGARNIVLLEREPFFGQGATGKCAGGIRHQFATEVNIRLSLASIQMLERFEDELGQGIDLRWCGYLFLLTYLFSVQDSSGLVASAKEPEESSHLTMDKR